MTETDAALDVDEITPTPDLTCKVCGAPLQRKPKGFQPVYCDEHKRGKGKTGRPVGRPRKDGTPPGSDSTPKPAAPRNNAAINRAISTLEMIYGMIGTGMTMTVAPGLGRQVVNSRADLAESYRMLLETNKAFRDWFAGVEDKAAWLPIIVVHGDLIVNYLLSRQIRSFGPEERPETATDPTDYTQPFEYSNGEG